MFTNQELERNGFHILKPGEDLNEQFEAEDNDSTEENNEDNNSWA